MITIVEGAESGRHPNLINEMFRMRAAVFSDRLEWDVTVADGREIDRFDAEDPLYLLSLDERTGVLQGAVRLLHTTGPNVLRDVFPVLVPGGVPASFLIWEGSRFTMNPATYNLCERTEANYVINCTTSSFRAASSMSCRSSTRR